MFGAFGTGRRPHQHFSLWRISGPSKGPSKGPSYQIVKRMMFSPSVCSMTPSLPVMFFWDSPFTSFTNEQPSIHWLIFQSIVSTQNRFNSSISICSPTILHHSSDLGISPTIFPFSIIQSAPIQVNVMLPLSACGSTWWMPWSVPAAWKMPSSWRCGC